MKVLNFNAQYTTKHTPSSHNMSVINTLCTKFISIQVYDWLTALLPSVVKNAKWQLTRVKRCRSKPPSFM